METNWIIRPLLLLAVTLVSVTAVPEEGHLNFTEGISTDGTEHDLHTLGVTNNKIMTAQYECYQKIMQAPANTIEGPHCNRTWDGWLCWDSAAAGVDLVQNCPDYFQDFDPSEKVIKSCDQSGHWFIHPESNRTWTNYTLCTLGVTSKLQRMMVQVVDPILMRLGCFSISGV
ncbi:UNVERIFIED_CONTAM: hypothetical protein K2H54_046637 [Gekko kuhli]